jgi:hypothetical protein
MVGSGSRPQMTGGRTMRGGRRIGETVLRSPARD